MTPQPRRQGRECAVDVVGHALGMGAAAVGVQVLVYVEDEICG